LSFVGLLFPEIFPWVFNPPPPPPPPPPSRMSYSCPVPDCTSSITAEFPGRIERHCQEVHDGESVTAPCAVVGCGRVFTRVAALDFTRHYCDHFRFVHRDHQEEDDARFPQEAGWEEYLAGEDQRINSLPDLPDWLLDGTAFSSGEDEKDVFLTPLPKMSEGLADELDFLLYEIRNSVTTKCCLAFILSPIASELPMTTCPRSLPSTSGIAGH